MARLVLYGQFHQYQCGLVLGNILLGIVIWSGVAGHKRTEFFGQQGLMTVFLYFNLKRKPTFTKYVGHTYLST